MLIVRLLKDDAARNYLAFDHDFVLSVTNRMAGDGVTLALKHSHHGLLPDEEHQPDDG
jgi:hypothetical protein